MRIQLTIILSLLAIANAVMVAQDPMDQGNAYSGQDDPYSTYGVHGSKLSSGGNSACPNEPIVITIGSDKVWSLCCGNEIKVLPVSSGSLDKIASPKCCGQNPYLPTKSICCGGIITEITGANSFPACCNNVLYNRQKFVCCNNQLIELNSTLTGVYECCGFKPSTSPYGGSPQYGYQNNYGTYGGNYGGNYGTNYGATYNATAYNSTATNYTNGGYRMKRQAYGYGAYSGYAQQTYQSSYQDQLVDITKELCCSGVVHPLPSGLSFAQSAEFACCGNQIFRNDIQACCGSVVVNRTASRTESCCGGELFDPSINLCCNNHVQPKNHSSNPLKCCGTNVFDPKSQKCCAGYVVNIMGGEYNYNTKCCGINIYDASSHICCSGVPVRMIPNVMISYQRCCGLDVYDITKWTCCNQESRVPKGKKCSYY